MPDLPIHLVEAIQETLRDATDATGNQKLFAHGKLEGFRIALKAYTGTDWTLEYDGSRGQYQFFSDSFQIITPNASSF